MRVYGGKVVDGRRILDLGRPMVKKILLDIHIYLSLLCAGYMVIYGVSGLAFNHHIRPAESDGIVWETTIDVPTADKDQVLAEAVRDRLELMGWVPFWWLSHPQPDEFVFFINRPAREYRVRLNQLTGHVGVSETSRGVLGAIIGLHGLQSMPNSRWAATWAVYTEISIWAVVFSVVSGIWFWWLRPACRSSGWWLLGLGSGGSILLMLYVVG